MFTFFSKKPKGEKLTLKIGGMHCTSCAMNIDGALEDTKGVFSSTTNYAKSQTTVDFDSKLVSKQSIQQLIEQAGYTVVKE